MGPKPCFPKTSDLLDCNTLALLLALELLFNEADFYDMYYFFDHTGVEYIENLFKPV